LTNFQISVLLFLQIAVILGACRLVGRLVRPFGQPQVVAEMITGVLLGPSLLGWLVPDLHARLALEAVYGSEPSDVDPVLDQLQAEALREEW